MESPLNLSQGAKNENNTMPQLPKFILREDYWREEGLFQGHELVEEDGELMVTALEAGLEIGSWSEDIDMYCAEIIRDSNLTLENFLSIAPIHWPQSNNISEKITNTMLSGVRLNECEPLELVKALKDLTPLFVRVNAEDYIKPFSNEEGSDNSHLLKTLDSLKDFISEEQYDMAVHILNGQLDIVNI